jgi:hypothetical protein
MQEESALTARGVIAPTAPPIAARGYFRRVWDHWRQAAHALGVVQTRFLMLIIYALVVVPTGILMRMFRDPLHLRPPETGNWTPTRPRDRSVDDARNQF